LKAGRTRKFPVRFKIIFFVKVIAHIHPARRESFIVVSFISAGRRNLLKFKQKNYKFYLVFRRNIQEFVMDYYANFSEKIS